LRAELEGNKVDLQRSMVVKLRNQVENKVLAAKHHSGEKDVEKDSNLNLIKRF